MNNLNNKVSIITGGTSGIGEACVEVFAKAGSQVAFTGRNINRGKEIEENLKKQGLLVKFFPLDITNDEEIRKTHDEILKYYGKIDILFNNAGVYLMNNPLEEITRDNWENNFEVNCTSMVMVIKYFIKDLIRSHGTILNNASIAGIQHFISGKGYGYAASKSAVIQLTKMLAKVYGMYVRINCISPGVIKTPLYNTFDENKFNERIPLKRVGQPIDVANVANFLVSDDAAYIHGTNIVVDGGITL